MSTYSSPNPYASPQDVETIDEGKLAEAAKLLGATRPWVLMFAIVSVLLAVLCGFGTIGVAFLMFAPGGAPMAIAMGFMYLVMTAFYIMFSVLLFRFSSAAGDFRQRPEMSQLNKALRAQKSFWKLAGISFLLFIVMYVIGIGLVVATGIATSFEDGGAPPAGFEFGPGDFEVGEFEESEP